jgi:acetate kinase
VPIKVSGRTLPCLLAINGGSSSIRFAVYEAGTTLQRRLGGKIDRIGLRGTSLVVTDPTGTPRPPRRLPGSDHRAAIAVLLDWLEVQPIFASIKAV